MRNRVNNVENYNSVHNASKAYKKCINFNMYKKDFCGGSFCFMSWCLKMFCAVGALCMFSYF